MKKPGTKYTRKPRLNFEISEAHWAALVEKQREENQRQAELIDRLFMVAERLGHVSEALLLQIPETMRPMALAEAQLRAEGKIVTIATHVC